jgi:hypothetical protein
MYNIGHECSWFIHYKDGFFYVLNVIEYVSQPSTLLKQKNTVSLWIWEDFVSSYSLTFVLTPFSLYFFHIFLRFSNVDIFDNYSWDSNFMVKFLSSLYELNCIKKSKQKMIFSIFMNLSLATFSIEWIENSFFFCW